jgi:hypothetical protein
MNVDLRKEPYVSPEFGANGALPRHRWYRFKEGFSAGLVTSFVKNYFPTRKDGWLLDPFLGSGTTALQGASLGVNVCGVEANPFMTFLSRVKTADYSALRNVEGIALGCMSHRTREDRFRLPNYTTLVQKRGLKKWLLNRGVALRFEQLRTGISTVKNSKAQNLLLLALIASVEEVANARKDGKCWRYRTNWRERKFNSKSLEEAFAAKIIAFGEDISQFPSVKGEVRISKGDARNLWKHLSLSGKIDGILTSPPYLNSFDYTDIYRPELMLLSEANSAKQLRELRFSTLRSHVQVAWLPSQPLEISLLKKTIKDVGRQQLWCQRIPQMINGYFVDLDRVIAECSKKLNKGAFAGFVVADSAYGGVVVPVSLILVELLERRGFVVKEVRRYRNNPGNGHHQQRSQEMLKEVMVLAQFGVKVTSRIRTARKSCYRSTASSSSRSWSKSIATVPCR